MKGPVSAETWEAAFQTADFALGLPKRHKFSRFIHHVFSDVSDFEAAR
jgi:putative hemolysin